MTTASSSENAFGAGKLLKGSARGLCLSLICAIVLLLLFSLICYTMPDPDKYLTVFGLAALYLSALLGGIAAGKKSGLVGGVVSGLLLCAVILLASSFKGEAPALFSPGIMALLYILIPAVGALGGFLAGMGHKGKGRKGPRGTKRRK